METQLSYPVEGPTDAEPAPWMPPIDAMHYLAREEASFIALLRLVAAVVLAVLLVASALGVMQ